MFKNIYLYVDLFFYFLLPLLLWESARGFLGDLLTILSASISGFIYSSYRFYKMKKINFTQLFLIINLIIGTLIDLFSNSALQILWNDVYFSLGLSIVYVFSLLINKPLFLLFAIDLMEYDGYERKLTKELLTTTTFLNTYKLITLLNSIRELFYSFLLFRLIIKYGVDAYHWDIILDQAFNLVLSIITMFVLFYTYRMLNKIEGIKKRVVTTKKRAGWLKLMPKSSLIYGEFIYFFFCNTY